MRTFRISIGAACAVALLAACATSSPPAAGAPSGLTAAFDMVPSPRGSLAGSWYWEFDAGASEDPDGSIVEYRWNLAGIDATLDWTSSIQRGFGRNGTYQVALEVADDDGNTATVSKQLVVDDLPYDYWGLPPERVNVTAGGVVSDAEVEYGFAISADGRYVTFSTVATNLHPDDANGLTDIYLKDMDSGGLELISRGGAGLEAWSDVAVSADARYVAYTEEDDQPTGTGPNRIRVVDRQAATVEEVVNPDGFDRNRVRALSADGRTLAYQARTLNVAVGGAYVQDLDTDDVVRLGLRLDGATYAAVELVALSADGTHAVFESSDANLVPGDANGVSDVFVTDLGTMQTVRASETAAGGDGDGASRAVGPVVSADGQYVAFWSEATNFVADDVNGTQDDVFLKDLATGALELISANASGEQADAASVLPALSADGRFVAFGSYAENLAPHVDPYDVCVLALCTQGLTFVKDRETGRVVLASAALGDSLPNDWDQIEPTLSADGRYVGYYSWASNLVTGDVQDTLDYFRTVNPLAP